MIRLGGRSSGGWHSMSRVTPAAARGLGTGWLRAELVDAGAGAGRPGAAGRPGGDRLAFSGSGAELANEDGDMSANSFMGGALSAKSGSSEFSSTGGAPH